MKTYITNIKAICPITNEIRLFEGPKIKALSLSDADYYCQNNGLGYCFVIGELVSEYDTLNINSLN